jgi:rod shape-determining protein MreD
MFAHVYWLVFLTVVLTLWLDVLTLPDWLKLAWPEWTALIVVFWVLRAPRYVGVLAAWVVGLFSDVVHAQPLGLHALSFAVVGYLCQVIHQRVRVFPLWQQCVTVCLLLGIAQMVQRTIAGIFGVVTESWWYYLPALTGGCLWPLVSPLFHGLHRQWVATEPRVRV